MRFFGFCISRDIQDRSIIKIYRKEPLYASFPGSHITNGDLRVRAKDCTDAILFFIGSATGDKMGNVLRNISLIPVLWCTHTLTYT